MEGHIDTRYNAERGKESEQYVYSAEQIVYYNSSEKYSVHVCEVELDNRETFTQNGGIELYLFVINLPSSLSVSQ